MSAAELIILSTHAVFEVLGELGPQFERASGYRLSIGFDPANAIKRRIDSGALFDVAIVTRAVVDQLAGQGVILPDSCVDVARSGLGISVRKGAPKPDIATVDGFKRALLAAKTLVRSRDGSSGIYFDALLDRLGIADEMRGKITVGGSGRVAEYVARGDVDMAVQQISELVPVTGADYAGPFPAELQLYTMFSAGVGAASKHPQAATDFIKFITAPSVGGLYLAKGLEPSTRD